MRYLTSIYKISPNNKIMPRGCRKNLIIILDVLEVSWFFLLFFFHFYRNGFFFFDIGAIWWIIWIKNGIIFFLSMLARVIEMKI